MSNFNVPAANASQSALSLGGEWRSRDKFEANKYKMNSFTSQVRKRDKGKGNGGTDKTNERPRSSPGMKSSSSERQTPPKSAPPGVRQRCDRVHDLEGAGEPSARKNLDNHLPLKKIRSPVPAGTPEIERKQQINLGHGMTMTRSKSRLAVTINTGLPELPDSAPRRVFSAKEPPPPQGDPIRDFIQSWEGRDGNAIRLVRPSTCTSSRINTAVSPVASPLMAVSPVASPSNLDWYVSPVSSSLGNTTSPFLSPDIQDALILQLQQQVADLTLYLEEEKLNHRSTKEKAAASMRAKLNELERRHMEELQEITQEQEEQVEMIKEIHGKEMLHLRNSSNAALARMKGELEFLQGAFEAYKGTLVQDMEEKWNKKEIDMKLKFQEDMENALQEQRQDLLEEKAREKNQFGREFQKQMQMMQKEHKKEIDNMLIKFSSASSDVENLKKALDQLKRVQDQFDETVEKLAVKEDELRHKRMELAETRLRVTQYEENFQSKVDEVDERYKERIHHLMNDNIELRKRYMQKCDELFTEKSHTEKRRVEKLMTSKEVMRMLVHVKSRNNINMACSDPATDNQPKIPVMRPVSAPVTRNDKQFAFRSAGETKHLPTHENSLDPIKVPSSPARPQTVAEHRAQSEVMRDFSMMSPFRTESLQSI